MRLLHTGDLHIGKSVNEFSMLEDQRYILDKICNIAIEEKVDAIVIAGDIYDRSIPSADAVMVFDNFLTRMVAENIKIFAVAGNHDSPERINFANSLMEKDGVYICGLISDRTREISLSDEYGDISIHLLPYTKPLFVKEYFEDSDTYEKAVKNIIDNSHVDTHKRNVLVTHYFVTNCGTEPERSESENELSLGGTDNVDASVFADYDYTALGHIHGPQKIGSDYIRYSGSPLKYSFSEEFHKKGVYIVDLREKGSVEYKKVPLIPMRDMRKIKGKLQDLISDEVSSLANKDDYICAVLTDEVDLLNPLEELRSVYKNVCQVNFEKRDRLSNTISTSVTLNKSKTMMEYFEDFYREINDGVELDEDRRDIVMAAIREAGEQ